MAANLAELNRHIETSPKLSPEEKADTKAQVGVIAEAAAKPQEAALQRSARVAWAFLKGMGDKLSDDDLAVP